MNERPRSPNPLVEAHLFAGSLLRSEWTFRGTRNRIFVLLSGSGQVRLGRHCVAVEGPALVFAPAGETGAVQFEAGAEGAALAIPDIVLASAMPSGALFVQVRDAIARPILGSNIDLGRARHLATLLGQIEQELRDDDRGAHEVVRHQLALLLISIWRLTSPSGSEPRPSPRSIVRGFGHLAELHARDHWTISTYAGLLGVTADRLTSAVRRATGLSPMEFIHQRLAGEASRLLESSSLQVGEIADALGFRDVAYFSRFYKRTTGISPRDYRNRVALRRTLGDTNYAAWP